MVHLFWITIWGLFCMSLLDGQLQTPTAAESRTPLDSILYKGLTDVHYGMEEGSGSLPEPDPSSAKSHSQLYRSFLRRRKRSILFPSGVKVCPEETFEQALVNHIKFFKLRVCQETVWEVFKIFWDRLPDQAEYQHWMHLCEEGTMPAFEIGENFSRSEDHHKLVIEKLTMIKHATSSTDIISSPATVDNTTFQEAAANVPLSYEISIESYSPTSTLTQEENEDMDNEIIKATEKPRKPGDKMVEFRILILNEPHSKELSDKSSDEHKEFAEKFITEMESIFQALPGYKRIIVQKISPVLLDRRAVLEVQYAVIFDGDADAINNATLDLMNLHSNKIEDTSINNIEDNPTAVYTVSSFRNYIVDALKKQILIGEKTLDFNADSLQLYNVKNVPSHIYNEWTIITEKPAFPIPSTADVDNALQAEWLPTAYSTINTFAYKETSEDLTSRSQLALGAESHVVTEDIDFNLHVTPVPEYIFTTPSDYLTFQHTTIFSSLDSRTVVVIDSITDLENQEGSGHDILQINQPTIGSLSEFVSNDISLSYEGQVINTVLPPSATIPSAGAGDSDIVTSAIAAEEPALSQSSFTILLNKSESFNGDRDTITSEVTSKSNLETAEILVEDHLLPTYKNPESIVPLDEGSGSGFDLMTDEYKAVTWSWTKTTGEYVSSVKRQTIDIDLTETTRNYDELLEERFTDKFIEKSISLVSTEMSPVTNQDTKDVELTHNPIATVQPLLHETSTEPSLLLTSEYWNIDQSVQTPESSDQDVYLFPESDSLHYTTEEYLQSDSEDISWPVQTTEPPSQTSLVLDYDTDMMESSTSNEIEPLKPYIPVNDLTPIPTTNGHDNQFITSSDKNIILHEELLNTIPSLDTKKTHSLSDFDSGSENNMPNIIPIVPKEAAITDSMQYEPQSSQTYVGPTTLLTQNEVDTVGVQDISLELDHMSTVYFHPDLSPEERSLIGKNIDSTDLSDVIFSTHGSNINASAQARALVVFFSLRVTNMIFSEDLFNKNSPEYKSLEQRFLELLVPYLQSNLTGFQNLEILNFRNGSIIINSRMKFAKPVPRNVTNAVYIILEDFCNTAYQTMNLAIDKYSLDVESGDVADPCKFQACNEYSECLINKWIGEGECVCNPGYVSMDGLPCQSLCDLEIDFCQNDGKCDVIPGQGAICRCRVGENWWYRGEHCEEYVSEPLVVGIAIASVAGFLLVASAIIFFLARTLRDQSTKGDSEESGGRQSDSISSIENAVKYNPMYESDTTGYSHYYKRYPQLPSTSSTSPETSADFSSEEIRHIYENSELTKEEIQDRIRIIELYAKDRQFADFVRQHQMTVDNVRTANP
ncbi:interphotoreceptor matrix proteoglycan 2 isoform X2 [Pseudophryne corroboree]|uniref:interphotoreceptor matrix proteoglycan 2 isoform X2 n=1 Tax=Pseudophryne corroboree TaxID=495146 RepID=UPI0030812C5F